MRDVNPVRNLTHARRRIASEAWTRAHRRPILSVVAKHDDEAAWRKRVGLLIVAFRERAGLSQEELAEAVGRSTAAVSRWENGHVTPSLWDGRRLAKALGAPADLLLRAPALPPARSPLEDLLNGAPLSDAELAQIDQAVESAADEIGLPPRSDAGAARGQRAS